MNRSIIAAALSFSMLGGCSSIVSQSDYPVTISSTPENASYVIVDKKEGYEKQQFVLKSTLDGWYFGNIMIGGLIGMLIVDPLTGAMYNLPDRVDVNLEQTVAASIGGETLDFATIDSLSPEQIAKLEKLN